MDIVERGWSVEHWDLAEKQLDILIECRSRNTEMDPTSERNYGKKVSADTTPAGAKRTA